MSTAPTKAPLTLHEEVFQAVNGHLPSEPKLGGSPLTEENKRFVRSIQPGERKNSTTKRITERYLKGYAMGKRLTEKRYGQAKYMEGADAVGFGKGGDKAIKAWNQIGRLQESSLIREWDAGEFEVNGEDGVCFNELRDRTIHALDKTYKTGTVLAESLKAQRSGGGQVLREHTVIGHGISQYGRYVDDLLRLGTWELCASRSVAAILGLVGRIRVDCGQNTLSSDLVPVDVWRELHPMAENEPTRFFGVGNPIDTTILPRHKIKFAYALKREAKCRNLDVFLREVMMKGGEQIDKYWAPIIIQEVLGLHDPSNPNAREWPFIINGQKFQTEYQEPAAANANLFPFWNMIYNQSDIAPGDDALFKLIEMALRDQRHMTTNEPMDCLNGPLDLLATGGCQVEDIQAGLGLVLLSTALGGANNAVAQRTRTARTRWNTENIFDDPWVEIYAREIMARVAPWSGWTEEEREQSLNRTFVAGRLNQAIVMTMEWDQEEFDMPTAWTNFDREDDWGRKFMQKSGIAHPNPQARFLSRGWPDTANGAALAIPTAPVTP